MTIPNQFEASLHYLTVCTQSLPSRRYKLCNHVLSDHRFLVSPGGSEHHHNYRHGLVIHVAEVMRNCAKMFEMNDTLVTAVVWHDYMKVRDYGIKDTGEVFKQPYRKLINHVAGSYAEFFHHATLAGESVGFIDAVGHCLLSHHGRSEWGSPVAPLTVEAYLLHTADMLSAKGINF